MRFQAIAFDLVGLTPLVQRPLVVRRAKKGKLCEFYVSPKGWRGIPLFGFRQALLGACKLEGHKLRNGAGLPTVRADGFDVVEGTALVRITKGKPRDASEVQENLAGGVVYDEGWEARVVVEFDADVFKAQEIVKVMITAGAEVGLGCKRPDAHRFLRRKAEPSYEFGTFAVEVGNR
jgi:hypothetical protein